jgi:geranylgeranyl pyrophosphate synthase
MGWPKYFRPAQLERKNMDLYQSTVDYTLTLPVMKSWPELQTLLTKTASMKPRHWELPVKACQAAGGSVEQAIPAVAAIACAQISIILIDDMLDEDPRGEHHREGLAKVANYAAAFQTASLEALFYNSKQTISRFSDLRNLNRMIFMTAFGQHLDIQNPSDEIAYWRIVENKSAPFFGAALYHGAVSGRASNKVIHGLERLGRLYGEMIQIHDDLHDTMAVPANPDWIQKRLPLPILFAKIVEHPDRIKFLELCEDISKPEALSDAQDILVRSGAISYCIDQLLYRHQVAQAVLASIPLVHPKIVMQLLEEVVTPVWRLFQSMGRPPSLFSTGNGLEGMV